ncbi:MULTISPECIES: RDD family protein [Microbulbifer]|uniref:RDD family protein n=1 Tax=Microbulbifer celer TaxID=435905 RepID=A0ABW3U8K6_9GAMM|nr:MULTISPECIES: RDD family protein [Microbulbifer]UFN58342.1 RDD family protein [Microbulbifer celer]
MNPWQVLGIEACDDPRAVKRAYAKQLKQNRPDEKPEAFQQLHTAYKQALHMARSRAQQREAVAEPAAEPVAEPQAVEVSTAELPPNAVEVTEPDARRTGHTHQEVINDEGAISEPKSAISEPKNADSLQQDTDSVEQEAIRVREDAARQLRIDEYRRVLAQVDALLEKRLQLNQEARWHFLAESPYMLEDEYNWNLGLAVFERFARFNEAAAARKGKYQTCITDNIIGYCDQLFGWTGNAAAYYREFDEDLADRIFDAVQEESSEHDPTAGIRGGSKLVRQKPKVVTDRLEQYFFGSLLGRALAVVLDIALIHLMIGVVATAVIMRVSGQSETDATFTGFLVSGSIFLVATWLAECSSWQTTPGKWLLGYRVTDKNFQRVGYLHGLWRTLSFTLIVPTFKIGWLINCFLSGNLLHDRMSRTYVINYRKSREEYLRRQK